MISYPNENCSVPFTGPNCDETFADSLGASFTALQATFASIFIVLALYSLYNTYLIIKKTGFCFETENCMLYMCSISMVIGAVRSVDAQGWADIYPLWLPSLMYDTGSSATITIWLLLVGSWADFVMRAVLVKHKRFARFLKKMRMATIAYCWISQYFATIIIYAVKPYWAGKLLRYCLAIVIFAVWLSTSSYFGCIIHRVLREAQRKYGDISSGSASVTKGHSMTSSVIGTTTTTTTTTNATTKSTPADKQDKEMHALARKRRRLALRRIDRLNFLLLLLELAAIIVLAVSANSWATDRYNLEPPNVVPLPQTAGDLIFEHIFDILYILVASVCLWFYRVDRSKGERKGGPQQSESSANITAHDDVESTVMPSDSPLPVRAASSGQATPVPVRADAATPAPLEQVTVVPSEATVSSASVEQVDVVPSQVSE
ncbi:hypothetical protein CAOG_03168 [Capsaspora owczarzaki ATCC 30864]|uniref:G-protein coupled receptors family 1 profile domain-containing protein n=1 Tax=Capsaspora owczarzaki (strain ATCC 30864) TaxID=595528 RepID=A0A0D2X291_CAPO3|nr:hypothetical protein CAOG_03168 [Capsaspora owczarzaki ATCC 30864]KJE92149.1 hypothetical protein CAOG_003168 [Capsaspora owczarzaki ATCC 30864]|eukprot:XP_004364007.1 hypothetical protein CAOG_03168 [Capsaspora owczarzaki ATCC 30864]